MGDTGRSMFDSLSRSASMRSSRRNSARLTVCGTFPSDQHPPAYSACAVLALNTHCRRHIAESRIRCRRQTIHDESQGGDPYEKTGSVRVGDVVVLRSAEFPGALVSDGHVDLSCKVTDLYREGARSQPFIDPLFVVCIHHTFAARSAYATACEEEKLGAHMRKSFMGASDRRAAIEKLRANAEGERLSQEQEAQRCVARFFSLSHVPRQVPGVQWAIACAVCLASDASCGPLLRRSYGRCVAFGERIQLQHLKSGKFLTALQRSNESEAVGGDAFDDTFDVLLQERPSQASGFAIEPRFKIQSHGEVLCYGDSIALALDKNAAVFLRADSPPKDFGSADGGGGHPEDKGEEGVEYVVSALRVQFAWRLERFASHAHVARVRASPGEPPAATHIIGGNAAQLVHNESGMQLVLRRATGSPRGAAGAGGLELAMEPPASAQCAGALAFWCVELDEWTAGAPLEFGAGVRLRHAVFPAFLQVAPAGVGVCGARVAGTAQTVESVFAADGGVRCPPPPPPVLTGHVSSFPPY